MPVLKYSSSGMLRSKIRSAPTFSFDMTSQAATVASIACCSGEAAPPLLMRFVKNLPPKRSSIRRSSGWNMMTSAMTPISRILLKIQLSV